MWLYDLVGISFRTLCKDVLIGYTVLFTVYLLFRFLRRLHYHYTQTFNFAMRTLVFSLFAALLIGTLQIAQSQEKDDDVYVGQRVSGQYTVVKSIDTDDSFSYATATYGLYEVTGDHTFEQSVSLVGYKDSGYFSGYAAWTYQNTVWQRLSVSATPLLDFDEYDGHFLNGQYILSIPFGRGFHADNVLGTKYFFDNNLNISYSPFLYHKWKDSDSGFFFDLGPRAYLNTYQEHDPDYWSPELYYQLGGGARLGMYGDPFTFVFDSFLGTSREKLESEWIRNNNAYLSFRTSYAFDSGFELFGSGTWASSRNIDSPVNFSQVVGNFGLAYNF